MNSDLVLIYSGYFICSIILAFLLNALFLKFSRTMGIRSNPELVRWSASQKPAVGGISFFVLFLLSIACYAVFFPYSFIPIDKKLLGLLGAVTLGFIIGLADDAYNTKPLLKLGGQIACGFILIASGQGISLFENNNLDDVLTILWVIGIMNAINMLDNMDAITATVSVFIFLEALVTIYITHDFYNVFIIAILGSIGSLCGFLFFNWHPSKLFMGDTGSQFLGIFLATIGIRFFWNNPDYGGNYFHSKQIIVTFLAFIIPLSDASTVILNRILRLQKPWVGGKDHTTHHLSYMGLSDSQVALLFLGISLISLMLIFVIQGTIVNWGEKHLFIFGSWILAVFGTLFTVTKYSKPPEKETNAKAIE
ncbi:MAG TPA: MraY family glycosyltransferase [Bacteroidia bacterium]|jgi:UDP-GlcNAc:undecaprenyl-phosphate GlcNAc-1-phosphate transferase|nr:MraY family glycosyltransferase [Bacteroidia bacterium]